MKLLLVLAVMTATCEQAHAAAVQYISPGYRNSLGYVEPSVILPVAPAASATWTVVPATSATFSVAPKGSATWFVMNTAANGGLTVSPAPSATWTVVPRASDIFPVGLAPSASVGIDSTRNGVTLAAAATAYIEAFGGTPEFCTTPTGNTGWLDFTMWTKAIWTCPPGTNWATIYIEGANSATAPQYSEAGSPLSGASGIIVGSTPNGVIDPCPRFLRWYVAGTNVASGVTGIIRWRATR